MIGGQTAEEGEVQPAAIPADGPGQVGVVGQSTIEVRHQRTRAAQGGGPDQHGDHASGPGLGFEHRGPASVAARFQIDDDVLPAGIAGEERLAAAQMTFLAVGQQNAHVALQCPRGLEGARDLQYGGHARRVVRRAGSGGHAVIVRHQQHRAGPGRGGGQAAH